MQFLESEDWSADGWLRVAGKAFLNKIGEDGHAEIGSVIQFDDGRMELFINAYPRPGDPMKVILDNPVPTHLAPIAAIVEFENGTARHEIGTAKFHGREATLVFYGTPAFEARLVISEGFKDIEVVHGQNH